MGPLVLIGTTPLCQGGILSFDLTVPITRQQYEQVNQHLGYHLNTMVLCQLRKVDPLSKHIWHTSLQMTALQKERIQTST